MSLQIDTKPGLSAGQWSIALQQTKQICNMERMLCINISFIQLKEL